MSLEALNERVKHDLACLAYGGPDWVKRRGSAEGHVYDVIIIGGGQSGLAAAFGLLRERVSNLLVLDENPEGFEGPWDTYARMITLRTPKHLTSIDLGIPSLTFRAWWEAQHGAEGWEALDKIPRGEWMNYLRWYRHILALPVRNNTRLTLIEPVAGELYRLHLEGAGDGTRAEAGTGAGTGTGNGPLLARKVILATGIQGGGEWHVPPLITAALPKRLYSHTAEAIDYAALAGKQIAILGGGASAFDNANHALSVGVAEAHIFVRRRELPRINPIRQMESSGMIEHYHMLTDAEKYAAIAHFFTMNQPPTNDTFTRAAAWPGFRLHLGSPWLAVREVDGQAVITTPQGEFTYDYLIASTGLVSDPLLRPELKLLAPHIARWSDRYQAPVELANPMLDAHPYLTPGFALTGRGEVAARHVHGIFVFNYSALASCGLSASAISGTRPAVPRLASAVADQLFHDDREQILESFLSYRDAEFVGQWPLQ
jgi:cation diffusion facilitator CzcD-associated flavoprotein CzcO